MDQQLRIGAETQNTLANENLRHPGPPPTPEPLPLNHLQASGILRHPPASEDVRQSIMQAWTHRDATVRSRRSTWTAKKPRFAISPPTTFKTAMSWLPSSTPASITRTAWQSPARAR